MRNFAIAALMLGLAGCASAGSLSRSVEDDEPPAPVQTVQAPALEQYGRNVIVVKTSEYRLYHVDAEGKTTTYPIGVGKQGFAWSGTAVVQAKREWPDWTPPKEMLIRDRKEGKNTPAYMKGGEDNPLGARALYLFKDGKDTLYRIHGTSDRYSIGRAVSSGCIRLYNAQVIDLYRRVSVGTKVVVLQ